MSVSKYKLMLSAALLVAAASVSAFGVYPYQSSEQPVVVSAVAPIFPPIAAAARATGEVIVEVKINRAGEVTSAKTQGSYPLLRKACEIAAARWKFAPAGEGAGSRTAHLTFVFRITDKEMPEAEITQAERVIKKSSGLLHDATSKGCRRGSFGEKLSVPRPQHMRQRLMLDA